MADAFVTDTHPLVFHATRGRGLSRRAASIFAACEARGAIVYVPTVVLWELTLLMRVGKVRLAGSFEFLVEALFANPAYQPLPLDVETVALSSTAAPNGDPFDTLIAATARRMDLPLITRDADLRSFGLIETIW